jgi:PAS domain S-box-containing protein
MFGAKDKSELIASLPDIFLPETENAFIEELLAIAERRTAVQADTVVRTLEGRRLNVMFTIIFSPSDHELRNGLVTLTDITARKHAEDRLRESQAHLQLTTEAAKIGTWRWNVATGELFWSDIHKQLWGYETTSDSFRYDDWARCVHEGDLRVAETAIERCLQGEAEYDVEYRVTPLGSAQTRWIRSTGRANFDAAGEAVSLHGVSLDVTARKVVEQALRESEERFRNMADHAPVMIWVTEPDAVCTYLSKSWYEFTAQTPDTGLAFGWLDAVHPDDRERAERALMAASEQGEPFRLECRFRRFDGEYRWAIASAVPRFGASGEFRGHIGSVFDITERKQIEEALHEADRRKDEFLATLSHELRNPLAPLRNSVQLLRMAGGDDASQTPVLEMMERQVGHLVRLVDDLLEMSRISRGVFELRRERVELAHVVRNAIETSGPLIEAANHELSVSLPEEPLCLDGDPVRLAQILANLLNNAAKYTEPGGKISVRARRHDGIVAVSVRDNGVGLTRDALPRLFDMFSRVDHASGRSQGGLGIGLALARRLTEMHGGTIDASSEGLGLGSEFVVRLPLAHSLDSGRAGSAEAAPAIPAKRVLVVDDNRDAGDSLSMILELLGADVRIARSGPEALEAFESYHPAVVVLDIGMPGMNGYEVAHRMRTAFPERRTALVALTGWGQEDDRRRARAAGFDHHLVKPADIGTLRALLASLDQPPPSAPP